MSENIKIDKPTWTIGNTTFKMIDEYVSGMQWDAVRFVANELNKSISNKEAPSMFNFKSEDIIKFLSAVLTPIDIEWDENVHKKNTEHFKKRFPSIETLEEMFDFFVESRAKLLGSWTWRWRIQDIMIEENLRMILEPELKKQLDQLQEVKSETLSQ